MSEHNNDSPEDDLWGRLLSEAQRELLQAQESAVGVAAKSPPSTFAQKERQRSGPQPKAMGEFYCVALDPISRYVYTRVAGRIDLVEDLVQECFLKLIKKLALFSSAKGTGKAWVFTLVRNVVIDKMRSEKRYRSVKSLQTDSPDQDRDNGTFDVVDIRAEDPLSNAIKQDQGKWVRRLLELLEDDEAEIVTLFYLDDLSIADVSSVIDMNPATVGTKLARSRDKLRKLA